MPNSKKDKEEKPIRKKTLLIIGVSSFVGSNLAEFFKNEYKVVGTYHKTKVSLPGVLTLPCDVLVKEEVQLVLFAFKPDITIYCAGMSSLVDCALNEQMADAYNTSGLFNVAEYCQRYKSQICYISSSYVFGGENKKYIEMDIPDPSTVYGKTQAAAEFYIQKTSLNYVVFRSGKLYGRGIHSSRFNWFENLESRMAKHTQLVCDDNIKMGFLDVFFLAMTMKLCFDKGVQNRLMQISSRNIMTHYEFANTYKEVFGLNADIVAKGKWSFPVLANMAASGVLSEKMFFNLDVANVEGFLNIELPTVKESLEFTFNRYHGSKAKKRSSSKGEGVSFI